MKSEKWKLTHSFVVKWTALILLYFSLAALGVTGAMTVFILKYNVLYLTEEKIIEMILAFDSPLSLFMVNHAYEIIIFAAALILLSLILFIFCMCSAGRRQHSDDIWLRYTDKCPFDIFCLIIALVSLLMLVFFNDIAYCVESSDIVWYVVLVYSACYPLVMLFCMSFAVRTKSQTLIKNMVVYRIIMLFVKFIRHIMNGIKSVIKGIPIVKKTFIWIFLLMITELLLFIMIFENYYNEFAFWASCGLIILNLNVYVIYLYHAVMMKQIVNGTDRILSGEYGEAIDTKALYGIYKTHAEQLSNISVSLNHAVDERIKSERMKTELITNVSHDIKTPLTSIINYIDLLKKSETQTSENAGYLEILDRQAARLKKLTEDVLEASKASSGAIEVKKEPTALGVLLEQAVGEYSERLESLDITLKLKIIDENIMINTDGKLMWRVFDNLISNICKYSAAGTRAYIEVLPNDHQYVDIVFKNISQYELNISGEELTERFVRGDRSRRTEGSGLGLSIARSLCELCGGEFKLEIDGDLFKVRLRFERI